MESPTISELEEFFSVMNNEPSPTFFPSEADNAVRVGGVQSGNGLPIPPTSNSPGESSWSQRGISPRATAPSSQPSAPNTRASISGCFSPPIIGVPSYTSSGIASGHPSMDSLGPSAKSSRPSGTQVGGDHYRKYKIQPVEFVVANGLGFLAGNVIKYVTRYKDKNGAEDIKKAIHYLNLILEFEYGS